MNYEERLSLFRKHATALLRGNQPEVDRHERHIYPDHALSHHSFVFALFAASITNRFGHHLEGGDLNKLLAQVNGTYREVSPSKVEALIRALYGEPELFAEVPQAEHLPLMWPVLQTITEQAASDRVLAARFEQAERTSRAIVTSLFSASATCVSQRGPEKSTDDTMKAGTFDP